MSLDVTEVRRRTEYNDEALKVAELARKSRYPGMIVGMEMTPECEEGRGILAVIDDVHNAVSKQHRYSPSFKDFEDAQGHKLVKKVLNKAPAPKKSVISSSYTRSLEDLL